MRKSYHPEYPFWRLQNDGVWELYGAEGVSARQSNSDAKKSELLKHGVTGAFPRSVYEALRRKPILLSSIAKQILVENFPESIHADLSIAVGLELIFSGPARRDPGFRRRVLTAYENRCAVCSFDLRIGDSLAGLEAAHIKWHQAGGPDEEHNGLALCVIHHKLFDRGAYTLDRDLRLLVSRHLHGGNAFEVHCMAFHGKEVRRPHDPSHAPAQEFLRWHHKEVFQGPARYC